VRANSIKPGEKLKPKELSHKAEISRNASRAAATNLKLLTFIPTESEIDQLIAGCSRRLAAFLMLLKETGARAGEIWHLRWEDIEPAIRTVRITREKGSEPRVFPYKPKINADA